MLALVQLEGDLHVCGHPLSETTDPEAITDYRARELTCAACATVERRKRNARDEEGLLVVAEKVWDHKTDTALVDDLD